ncbi:flavodoxin family protein [Candidatus Bipolaricaulota bacterium]|nr:flavodoxin family protein [Candidatus Bipolaricaulota bacterium]
MMNVLGIVGSPRKRGNTDVLVSQVLAGARAHGAGTEKLYLDDVSIRPCKACFSWAEGANASSGTTSNRWSRS